MAPTCWCASNIDLADLCLVRRWRGYALIDALPGNRHRGLPWSVEEGACLAHCTIGPNIKPAPAACSTTASRDAAPSSMSWCAIGE